MSPSSLPLTKASTEKVVSLLALPRQRGSQLTDGGFDGAERGCDVVRVEGEYARAVGDAAGVGACLREAVSDLV